MKIEVGKVYRCGDTFVKIREELDTPVPLGFNYIGVEWDLDEDRYKNTPYVGMFCEDGDGKLSTNPPELNYWLKEKEEEKEAYLGIDVSGIKIGRVYKCDNVFVKIEGVIKSIINSNLSNYKYIGIEVKKSGNTYKIPDPFNYIGLFNGYGEGMMRVNPPELCYWLSDIKEEIDVVKENS